MDIGTNIEATAAAQYNRPIEPAARTPPVPASAAPRARITSLVSGSSPPTGTGTGTATPTVSQFPTTGVLCSTGEARNAQAEAPYNPPLGLEPGRALVMFVPTGSTADILSQLSELLSQR